MVEKIGDVVNTFVKILQVPFLILSVPVGVFFWGIECVLGTAKKACQEGYRYVH